MVDSLGILSPVSSKKDERKRTIQSLFFSGGPQAGVKGMEFPQIGIDIPLHLKAL
jgi:hypothetical protein